MLDHEKGHIGLRGKEVIEEWRAVNLPDVNPNYEASNLGRIRSWIGWRGEGRSESPRILTHSIGSRGYERVALVTGLKPPAPRQKYADVHRLVASAFFGPPPKGQQVRHLNGDCRDNRLVNLLYGTARENAADRALHGTDPRGERNGNARLKRVEVEAIRCLMSADFKRRDVAAMFGTSEENVGQIYSGRSWK